MKNKAFKTIIAMVLSFSMVFSLVPMMAVNAETYYKSTPMTFTGVTKSTLGMTVSEYSGVETTVADYDVVADPDASSGQGDVLKMFATPAGKGSRLWYTMEESVTGIVKLGFKVKIDKAAGASPKGCILRAGSSYLIGVDGDNFCVGWGNNTDSLASAQKASGWNDFTLYLDVENNTMLAVDLNGTRFTGDAVNGSQYGFGYTEEGSLSNLNFAPTQFSLSANMTTYYDDIVIEEVAEVSAVEPVYYRYAQPFTNLKKSDIGVDSATKNNLYYTNNEYDNVDASDAYYDVVDDPDGTSGQGKVLKMFATPSESGRKPRLWYKLEESVSGIVKIGFKIKMVYDEGATVKGIIFRIHDSLALSVNGDFFYVGYDTTDSLGAATRKNEWNTFTLYMDTTTRTMLAIDLNGRRYTGDAVNGGQYGFDQTALGTGNTIQHLGFAPTHFGLSGGNMTTYYDDITIEELPVPTTGLVLESKTVEGTLGAGNDITIKVAFNNGTTALKNATAIAALYSEGGKLKAVKKATINNILPTEIETASIPMTLPEDYATSDYIRVFGIEGFKSLKPLGESK